MFACICVCECVSVGGLLRVNAQCSFPLWLILQGFQTSLPDRQPGKRLCDEKPKEAAEEILRLLLFGEAGKPLVRKGLFSKPCFLLHT